MVMAALLLTVDYVFADIDSVATGATVGPDTKVPRPLDGVDELFECRTGHFTRSSMIWTKYDYGVR